MDIYSITSQEVLERISRHCPDALSAYLQCINRSNEEGEIFFSKNLVEIDMSEEWRSFRSKIKKLSRENLLEWHPFDGGIHVKLVGDNENE